MPKAEIVFTGEDGQEIRQTIHEFTGSGIIQGIHNTDKSITSFARHVLLMHLIQNRTCGLLLKIQSLKVYDHNFKDIFQEVYDSEFKDKFEEAGLEYFYTLIDDAVARVMKTEGGFIWACKNYDGDVMSDMVPLHVAHPCHDDISPCDHQMGYMNMKAAHSTVQRHYYKHLKGEETSTNSVATIFPGQVHCANVVNLTI